MPQQVYCHHHPPSPLFWMDITALPDYFPMMDDWGGDVGGRGKGFGIESAYKPGLMHQQENEW